MTNILITGGNGYVATALHAQLSKIYNVTSVTRNDFDLTNNKQTSKWFEDKHFDVVIHTAISGGNRLHKDSIEVLDNNLKMYYNLLDNSDKFVKLINIGSGAELHATTTPYGLSKHVIRRSVLEKDSYYNLRIFAVFDENELDRRFIKASIINYINRTPIVIHQNKYMDFFYMKDFIKVVQYYIDNNDTPKEFDCCYEESLYLSQIANKINNLSEHKVAINVMNENFADNYVGANIPIDIKFIGMDAGIKLVYEKLLCKK